MRPIIDLSVERARLIRHLSSEIRDERVLEAMSDIPRELFIPDRFRDEAYEDKPLAIDFQQTISQPYIIALMTEALCLNSNEKVLEVGTGSGYQAAILSRLADKVVTVERIPELAEVARRRLDYLGCHNVTVHLVGDDLGWWHDAPYDAILVTAAAPHVPEDLIAQLVTGGRMIIPVGPRYVQELCRITRNTDGNQLERLGGCRFVSLIGKGAWEN